MMEPKHVRLHRINSPGKTRTLEGKIIDRQQHGYITPCGAWALYNNDGHGNILPGYEPAYFIYFIPKGKKKPWTIQENDVVIEEVG